MLKWVDILEVFITATLISYLIMPLMRTLASRAGFLDHPKDTKVHAHPMPLLGGVGIYLSFIIGIVATTNVIYDARLLGIFVGCTVLLIVGLIDDRMGMMPEVKLLAQILAAIAVVKAGVRVEFLQNYYLNTLFTYLWIVGITNSFNLLDNMNGLSSGIAGIAAVFFGIISWGTGQLEIAVISFALAGACLGFLKHNFPKAHIFMGDSGSLVIGFVLACIGVIGSWKSRFLSTSLAIPVLILAYPIFDTTLVTIIRIIEKRSVFQGGKDHSSHRLALMGLRRRNAVLLIYGICILLGISAVIVQKILPKYAFVVIGTVGIFLCLLGVRLSRVDTGRFGVKKRSRKNG